MKELTRTNKINNRKNTINYHIMNMIHLSHILELHLKAIQIIYNVESLLENGVNTEEDLKEFVYFAYGPFLQLQTR